METGERGSIDSFKAALEWCLKEKIKLVHMSVGTTNYIDAKKIENIIKQMVSNKMILCAALSNTNFPTWPAVGTTESGELICYAASWNYTPYLL